MNRAEEYCALLQELEETPARLDYAVPRARARLRRQKRRKYIGAPLIALSAVCFAFVLLVNVSAPFAMACARVPFFKELAEAVSFHPSWYAAVENEWVQPIGQSDTDNGYTMTVEYLIVDQKQLNVFYTIKGGEEVDPEDHYMPRPVFSDTLGESLTATVLSHDCRFNGELDYMTADFLTEDTVPSEVRLTCHFDRIWDESARETVNETVAEFEFTLSFDPEFTAQEEMVEVDQWLELDGQKVLLKSVEIYPTHVRINVEDHPDNTAWLRGLELYAEDEKGNRYETVKSGLSSAGSPDTPFTQEFRLDSSFFAESKHLTLNITGARWLEKDKQWTQVDLNTMQADFLPDGTEFCRWRREEGDLTLTFRNDGRESYRYDMFLSWRAPDGTVGYIRERGISGAIDAPGSWDIYCKLEDCPWDSIEMELTYSDIGIYDKPIKIKLF